MPQIGIKAVEKYLESYYAKSVHLLSMTAKGGQATPGDLKTFGYGSPLFLEYEVSGERKKAVLETMEPSSYGHDHFSDRAQSILWEHSAFNNLPRHVRSLDCGAFLSSGEIISTGRAQEFFLLTEFAEGELYCKDLDRIGRTNTASEQDCKRVLALSNYLAEIHSLKSGTPGLYTRRIRELLGHGECIMGLIDNYPQTFEFIDQPLLRTVELACVDWRWRIKHRTHRLSRVHGDFHPWNILFREDVDFTVLDRSRGEWGDPADDVTSLSINYLFSSLVRSGAFEGPLRKMFDLFWKNYLDKTQDHEICEVVAPFYAWRGLVIASPGWYPHLPDGVRRSLFNFIKNVLASDRFDPRDMDRYLV